MKQLEVQIMGQSYLLGCPEGGDVKLLEAVERVDTAMCKIRDAGKVRARERIAVLAALNLAFDHAEPTQNPASDPLPEHGSSFTSALVVRAETPARSTEPAGDADVLLVSLLERLDAALGEDGQLL